MINLSLASIFSGPVWQILQDTSAFGTFILIVLVSMSIMSWIIIINKFRQFREVERRGAAFRSAFARAGKMADAIGQAKASAASPMAATFMAGYDELTQLAAAKAPGGGVADGMARLDDGDYEIVAMTMERTVTESIGKLERLVIFLATTGNSAPFMGLLGTVVGIMDSFWAIGEMGSASLAVVAPGIAEALLATIVGLAAAIPAVIAYNWANSRIKFANDAANGFILEFLARAKKEAR